MKASHCALLICLLWAGVGAVTINTEPKKTGVNQDQRNAANIDPRTEKHMSKADLMWQKEHEQQQLKKPPQHQQHGQEKAKKPTDTATLSKSTAESPPAKDLPAVAGNGNDSSKAQGQKTASASENVGTAAKEPQSTVDQAKPEVLSGQEADEPVNGVGAKTDDKKAEDGGLSGGKGDGADKQEESANAGLSAGGAGKEESSEAKEEGEDKAEAAKEEETKEGGKAEKGANGEGTGAGLKDLAQEGGKNDVKSEGTKGGGDETKMDAERGSKTGVKDGAEVMQPKEGVAPEKKSVEAKTVREGRQEQAGGAQKKGGKEGEVQKEAEVQKKADAGQKEATGGEKAGDGKAEGGKVVKEDEEERKGGVGAEKKGGEERKQDGGVASVKGTEAEGEVGAAAAGKGDGEGKEGSVGTVKEESQGEAGKEKDGVSEKGKSGVGPGTVRSDGRSGGKEGGKGGGRGQEAKGEEESGKADGKGEEKSGEKEGTAGANEKAVQGEGGRGGVPSLGGKKGVAEKGAGDKRDERTGGGGTKLEGGQQDGRANAEEEEEEEEEEDMDDNQVILALGQLERPVKGGPDGPAAKETKTAGKQEKKTAGKEEKKTAVKESDGQLAEPIELDLDLPPDEDLEEEYLEEAAEQEEEDHPLAEEQTYFRSIDADNDGLIDPEEFRQHMEDAAEYMQAAEDEGEEAVKGRTVGREWLEMYGEDAWEHAFAGIDQNVDSKVTWDEWVAELFHDEPQEPVFRDGEMGNVMTSELMLTFDHDGDKHLNFDEVREFVAKYMTRSNVDTHYGGMDPESPDTDFPGSPPSGVVKKGGVGMSYVFLMDFDSNGDNKISVEEWDDGFGNEPEENDDDDDDDDDDEERKLETQDSVVA